MVDLVRLATIAFYIIALVILGQIALAPGITGKIFVAGILFAYYWFFIRTQQEQRSPNSVNIYYDRLKRLCRLNNPGTLRRLILTGDSANARFLKGNIIGGPVCEYNRSLEPNHPKFIKWVFLYTPDTGWVYSFPVIGWIMKNFRREILFAVFHNPDCTGQKSQLINPARMLSKDPRDRHYTMLGDLEVRGINTQFIREMEYVNDELFNVDAEMWALASSVNVLVLEQDLENLAERIRKAIDSNSVHQRTLDLKDFVVGNAKTEGTAS